MKKFLDINEVSEYLSVKRSTLYSMVERGEIPHYRIGRLIRFRVDDLDCWMESHKKGKNEVDAKVRGILKATKRQEVDIDVMVKKSIEKVKALRYDLPLGNQVESSTQKGGDHGAV